MLSLPLAQTCAQQWTEWAKQWSLWGTQLCLLAKIVPAELVDSLQIFIQGWVWERGTGQVSAPLHVVVLVLLLLLVGIGASWTWLLRVGGSVGCRYVGVKGCLSP